MATRAKKGTTTSATSKKASVPKEVPAADDDADSDDESNRSNVAQSPNSLNSNNGSAAADIHTPTQRVKAATATDEEYERHRTSCAALEAFVDRVKHNTLKYLEHVKGFCEAGHSMSADWKMFYERTPDRLTTVAIRNENTHLSIKTEKRQLLEKFLRDKVINHIDKYKAHSARVKVEMAARDTKKKTFEHYTVKMIKLRAERDKLQNKGKPIPPKDIQRIERNEQKLAKSRSEYIEANNNTTKLLRDTWRNRYAFLDPLFNEVVKTESLFMQALSHSLGELQPELKRAMTIGVTIDPPPASEQPHGSAAATSAESKTPSASHDEGKEKKKAKVTSIAAAGLTSPRPPQSTPPAVTEHHHQAPEIKQPPLQQLHGDDGWDADFSSEPIGAAAPAGGMMASPIPQTTAPAFDPFANFNDATPVVTSPVPAAASVANVRPLPSFDAFPAFDAPPVTTSTGRGSVGFPSVGANAAFDPFSTQPSGNGPDPFGSSFGDDPFASSTPTPIVTKTAAPVPTAFPSPTVSTNLRLSSNPFDVLPTDASASVPVTPSAVFGRPSPAGVRNPFDEEFGAPPPVPYSASIASPAAALPPPAAAPVSSRTNKFNALEPLPMLEGAPSDPPPVAAPVVVAPPTQPALPAAPIVSMTNLAAMATSDPFGFSEPANTSGGSTDPFGFAEPISSPPGGLPTHNVPQSQPFAPVVAAPVAPMVPMAAPTAAVSVTAAPAAAPAAAADEDPFAFNAANIPHASPSVNSYGGDDWGF